MNYGSPHGRRSGPGVPTQIIEIARSVDLGGNIKRHTSWRSCDSKRKSIWRGGQKKSGRNEKSEYSDMTGIHLEIQSIHEEIQSIQ